MACSVYTSKIRKVCVIDETEAEFVRAIARLVIPTRGVFGVAKLLDHLYLGSRSDAMNIKKLERLGITHILNAIDGTDQSTTSESFYGNKFKYFGFSSDDSYMYPIMNHFEDVYNFIEDARISGGKCFIHCRSGINRSGALSVGYVMVHKNIGPVSAARLAIAERGCVLNNSGFIQRVVKFASERNLLHHDADEVSAVK